MSKPCSLCQHKAAVSSDFCETHKTAESNVKQGFKEWARAYDGDISMEKYLRRIIGLPETGERAKEVARHLLKK